MENKKTLILVGGGHAHLYIISKLKSQPIKEYNIILISEENRQYYSGMASAYLEGIYTERDFSVDLISLCKKSGVSYINDEVIKIDPDKKNVKTRSGEQYSFDLISFDTGSRVANYDVPGAREYSNSVKPLSQLHKIKEAVLNGPSEQQKVAIIGGGASGVEISLALKQYAEKNSKNIDITLINKHEEILSHFSKKAKQVAQKELEKANINILINEEVEKIDKKRLYLKSKKTVAYDIIILAAGSTSHSLYADSGLKVDSRGYMLANKYLQSVEYQYILGAGDCITFEDYPYVTKVGVYAIREAPVLLNNLVKISKQQPLTAYIPQKRYLAILSLGNRKGLILYKNKTFSGKWVWLLKNYIDVKFIKQYQ